MMLGNIAYNRNDQRRFALFLLNNILGGPAMNSRLNLAVRERHGYAYNIESVYLPYTDTGVFSLYLGTDNSNLEKSIKLIRKEMDRFYEEKMSQVRLSQAKKQLIGQVEIANESNLNYLMAAGKAFLHDHKLDSADELRDKIQGVTPEQIVEVAREILDPASISRLIFHNPGE
jgi:predicted Zn-dependent peptidase